MKLYLRIILMFICALMWEAPVFANGIDFSDSQGYFGVPHDNVGIGSSAPGKSLDVQGTIRTVGFTMSGTSPISGYVLTANDSAGDTTWSPAGGVGGWTISGANVYQTYNGNVGIGTNLLTTAALTVMNGNVGIGTWKPGGALEIEGGNVGIGTNAPSALFTVNGSSILGIANSSTDSINSLNGGGSLAGGVAGHFGGTTGSITSSGYGDLAFGEAIGNGSNASIISGSSAGSIAMGYAFPGTLESTSAGSIAMGFADGGTLESTGFGSIAMGFEFGGTGILGATGQASVAIGENVQATANNAFALGLSVVNPNASSFMVGFNATPTLTVTGTGVGIGTSSPFGGGLIVLPANTGNVGIGSLIPGQALDVQGTARMTGFTLTGNGAGAGNVLVGNGVGVGTWMPASTLSVSGVGSSGWTVSGNNVYETAGGNVGIGTTLLTTSALTVMNGNVGIGTWVPSALFTVDGNSILGAIHNSLDSIISNGTGTLAGGYANDAIGGGGLITSSGTGSFAYGSVTGNVVTSNITANGNGSIAMGLVLGGGQFLQSTGAGSVAMGFANNGILQATGNGSVAIGQNVQATANNALALGQNVVNPNASSFMVGFNATPTLAVTGTGVGIGTSSPFGGGLIVLPASTGNVGIGSLTPGQMLDVQGTVRSTGLTMSGHAPIAGYVLTASDSAGDTTWSSAGGVSGWTVTGSNVYETGNGNVGIGTTMLTTAALTVMNGNVGIGTWVPADVVDIHVPVSKDGLRITDNTSQDGISFQGYYPAINFNSYYDGLNQRAIGPDYTGAISLNPTGDLQFYTGNKPGAGAVATLTQRVFIQNSGNVGLGTIVPGQLLDVQGTVRDTGELINGNVGIGTSFVNGAGEAALTVMNGNVGIGTWVPADILQVGKYTGGQNGFDVDANGNVGIGTANPSEPLEIYNINISPEMLIKQFFDAASATFAMQGSLNSGTWTFSAEGANVAGPDNLDYKYNGSTKVSFTSSGNVGIGTIAPSALFTVNGSSILGYVNSSTDSITSSSSGSLAGGIAAHVGSGLGSITASNQGSLAFGYALGSVFNGVITANGVGSIALGIAGPNETLQATGSASVAIGENVQATNNNNFSLGKNMINSLANTFMVGFNATPTLTVTGTNVGIGTFNPFGGGLIVTNGNVGIGSLAPGRTLDVNGSVRTTGFTMSGQAPIAGYVLTSSDSAGDTTWSNLGGVAGVSGWTVTVNNVYETNGGNVGIGTNLVTTSALTVMNGNVGIGTWVPQAVLLNVVGGNVGIGTNLNNHAMLEITGNGSKELFRANDSGQNDTTPFEVSAAGNVGIGTSFPNYKLDVQSDAGATDGPIAQFTQTTGYLLVSIPTCSRSGYAVSDTSGGWMMGMGYDCAGSFAIDSKAGFYGTTRFLMTSGGNVGIGTYLWSNNTYPQSRLVVGGGVGIGTSANSDFVQTSAPLGGLIVENNVGIGTFGPLVPLDIENNIGTTRIALRLSGPYNYPANTIQLLDTISGGGMEIGSDFNGLYFMRNDNTNGTTAYGTNQDIMFLQRTTGNVGIGTNTPAGALTVMNGNVGIGTWVPGKQFDAVATNIDAWAFETTGSNNALDIIARTAGFQASITFWDGGTADWQIGKQNNAAPSDFFIWGNQFSRNALTVSGATGNMSLQPTGGNVGIGTTFTTTAGLSVMNGNVGIGTWVPGSTLQVNNTITFQSEFNIGSQGGAFTVNWNQGNREKVTLTGATAHVATFTAPTSGVSNLVLKVVEGSATNTVTWPASVKWPSASTPVMTTVNGQEDLVACYWDGTDYLCTAALNYTP